MFVEPNNLNGKTIKDCFMTDMNRKMVMEMEDGTRVIIATDWTEDEISGEKIDLKQIVITQTV